MVTLKQIRTAVTVGKLFQKARREKGIELHAVSSQSGIPMELLVKIESGNLLALKHDTKSIEHISHIVAKNLQINIEEHYPPKVQFVAANVVELFPKSEEKNILHASS